MKKKSKDRQSEAQSEGGKTDNKDSNRNIYLFGRLENEVTLPTIKKLLRFNKLDGAATINLYINSAGGNGYNADAIIAVMNQISAPVNTICLGHALSGACEILASGTGIRSSYEFATLMFHQTLWEADGDITNLEIQAAQGLRFREAQIELLHRCTGKESARIRKDIERDYYMSAQEAFEYGIIDQVIKHERKKSSRNESIEGNQTKSHAKSQAKSSSENFEQAGQPSLKEQSKQEQSKQDRSKQDNSERGLEKKNDEKKRESDWSGEK